MPLDECAAATCCEPQRRAPSSSLVAASQPRFKLNRELVARLALASASAGCKPLEPLRCSPALGDSEPQSAAQISQASTKTKIQNDIQELNKLPSVDECGDDSGDDNAEIRQQQQGSDNKVATEKTTTSSDAYSSADVDVVAKVDVDVDVDIEPKHANWDCVSPARFSVARNDLIESRSTASEVARRPPVPCKLTLPPTLAAPAQNTLDNHPSLFVVVVGGSFHRTKEAAEWRDCEDCQDNNGNGNNDHNHNGKRERVYDGAISKQQRVASSSAATTTSTTTLTTLTTGSGHKVGASRRRPLGAKSMRSLRAAKTEAPNRTLEASGNGESIDEDADDNDSHIETITTQPTTNIKTNSSKRRRRRPRRRETKTTTTTTEKTNKTTKPLTVISIQEERASSGSQRGETPIASHSRGQPNGRRKSALPTEIDRAEARRECLREETNLAQSLLAPAAKLTAKQRNNANKRTSEKSGTSRDDRKSAANRPINPCDSLGQPAETQEALLQLASSSSASLSWSSGERIRQQQRRRRRRRQARRLSSGCRQASGETHAQAARWSHNGKQQQQPSGHLIARILMAFVLWFLVASTSISFRSELALAPGTPTSSWLGSFPPASLMVASAELAAATPSQATASTKADELSRAILATMSTQSSIELSLGFNGSTATATAIEMTTTATATSRPSGARPSTQPSASGRAKSSRSTTTNQDEDQTVGDSDGFMSPQTERSNLEDSGEPLVAAATPSLIAPNNNNNNNNNNDTSTALATQTQPPDAFAAAGGAASSYTVWDQLLDFGRIFIMGAIIVGDICGNSLVILSVCRHSKLRVTTNWFVVSLACADILVAVFAMTFNASVIISGRWLFPRWMCDFWNSCDVLASTASILHLCCISIDRYIAIMRPLDYPMKITTRRVMYTLCAVWISSALLSYIPIFTGIYTTAEHIKWLEENPDQCEFVVNRVYAVVSSAISFWIPCCIMVFTYYRIYREATRQEKFIYKAQSIMPAPMPNHHHHHHNNHKSGGGGGQANRSKQRRSKSMAVSGSGQPTGGISKEERIRQLAKQQQELQAPRALPAHLGQQQQQQPLTQSSGEIATTNLTTGGTESDPLTTAVDVNNNNNNNNSSSNNHTSGAMAVSIAQPTVPPVSVTQPDDDGDDQNSDSGQSTPTKRSISKMKREHKAAKTLGIIMGVFILCWLPFFLWYTPQNICGHACDRMIPPSVVTLLFWIGYFNSTLNPIIYAYFNHEFRDAFKKTLQWIFCCCEDLKCLRVQRPNDNQRYNCTYRSTQEIGLVNS